MYEMNIYDDRFKKIIYEMNIIYYDDKFKKIIYEMNRHI